MMKHEQTTRGFTLVELIVSLAITSILMLGLSTFFSSTFYQLFKAQNESSAIARQFAANEIIRNKFANLEVILSGGGMDDGYIFIKNKITKNVLPFSYIGLHEDGEEKRLVFKDVMLFNKIIDPGSGGQVFGDFESGGLKRVSDGAFFKSFPNINNFAGYTKVGDDYYVAVPDENVIKKCKSTCSDFLELTYPMDVATDGKYLFIADSGADRILRYRFSDGNITPLNNSNYSFNFPTGLVYYPDEKTLFVADSYNNRVVKIAEVDTLKLNYEISVIVGDGDNENCSSTAKFCKLSLPTGLYLDEGADELYISDSGNGRVLKVSDPEPTQNIPTNLELKFGLDKYFAWDKIKISDSFTGEGFRSINLGMAQYDSGSKVIENNRQPNHFYVNGDGACDVNSGPYVKNLNGINEGDHLIINGKVYLVESVSGFVCSSTDSSSDKAYLIALNQPLGAGVDVNTPIYLANSIKSPDLVHINLENVEMKQGGFQTIQIETYVHGNSSTPIETDVVSVRVGDGVLGTDEDVIEVIAENLNFPTGLSQAYIVDSGDRKILRNNGAFKNNFSPVNISAFSRFDYVSDFEVNSLNFSKYNCSGNDCDILELEVATDEQTYTISIPIP